MPSHEYADWREALAAFREDEFRPLRHKVANIETVTTLLTERITVLKERTEEQIKMQAVLIERTLEAQEKQVQAVIDELATVHDEVGKIRSTFTRWSGGLATLLVMGNILLVIVLDRT